MEDNTFCILPFIHLYSEPGGEMKPCCISDGFDSPLNLKTMSIEDSFNSVQMKELRKDMLSGKKNKVCDVCYKREESTGHSPRVDIFNKNTIWKMPEVNEDFSVSSDFQHIDIRFSNLCNFKCRMCNHDFSSNWYQDSKIIDKNFTRTDKILKIKNNISEELLPHLSKIKSIYFAGGEPLIMPEHYDILTYLYDTLKPIVVWKEDETTVEVRKLSIHYNTNLSVISYDEQSLITLWKGFERVFLSISCDGINKVGEYQRTGFDSEKFESNLNIIKKYANPAEVGDIIVGIAYNFQFTTTIFNVYHIFDFIDYMLEKNYITNSSQIDFSYSWKPKELSLNNLPKEEKKKVIEFLKLKKNLYSTKTNEEIDTIIKFIGDGDGLEKVDIDNYIKKIESLHGGNFNEISPIRLESNKDTDSKKTLI